MQYIIVLSLVVLIIYILYKPYGEGFTSLDYVIPRIAWSYWEGDGIPETIQLIQKRTKSKLPNWDIKLITKETLHEYIDPSTIPSKIDNYGVQHRADWYRVALLKKYGGMWLDASIVINDGAAIEKLYSESVDARSEFTGFTLGDDPEHYIENWFMLAPKGSEVISKLYDEFTVAIEKGFIEYKNDLEKEKQIIIIPKVYEFGDTNVYLTQHACMQAVIQSRLGRKPRLVLKPAENDMFKIQTDCKWDFGCLANKLTQPEIKEIPYLKLRGGERDILKAGYFTEGFIPVGRVGWAN